MCPGSPSFVLNAATFDPPVSLRGPSCPDIPLLVLSFPALDASLSIQSSFQLELATPVAACARLGSFYALSVITVANLESFPFVHSVACLDPTPSAPDPAGLNLSLSLRSFSCTGSSLAVLGLTAGSLLLVLSSSHLDATSLSRSTSHLDFLMPLFDVAKLELPLPARSFA